MKIRFYRNFDKKLLAVMFIIFAIGLSAIYSATHAEGSDLMKGLVFKQMLWMAIALILFLLILNVDYQRFIDWAYVLFGLNLILLVFVSLFGRTKFGAQRWFAIGAFGFQPSEFIKLALILVLSSHLGMRAKFAYKVTDLILPFIITAIPLALIFIQPDLGTALALIPILFTMLFARGVRMRHLVAIVILGFSSAPFMWHMLKDYQRERLAVFINPNTDPLGAGYTIIQSRIAIGSGGIAGKGWLSGTQNQLNFLPERHTDFIFSVIGEEGGLIGCLFLIGLYAFLIYRAIKIADTTGDTYGKIMAAGITGMFAFQVVINIGMASGFLPVVGIPLPLLSYGGSSLITSVAGIGLLLNIGMRRTQGFDI